MTLGRIIEEGGNLALVKSLRAEKIRQILGEKEVMGLLLTEIQQLSGESEEGDDELEQKLGENEFNADTVREALLSVFRKLTYRLRHGLKNAQMHLEEDDMTILKEMVERFFEEIVSEESGSTTMVELEDWDIYLASLYHESMLFERDGKAGTEVLETMAIECVEENLLKPECTGKVMQLRTEVMERIAAATYLSEEMTKELKDRIYFLCEEVFMAVYQTLAHPKAFLDFVMSEMHNLASENCESDADVMVKADALRAESRKNLQKFDGVLNVHASWLKNMFENSTAYRPGEGTEELWEAIFDLWLSDVVDNMKEQQVGELHFADERMGVTVVAKSDAKNGGKNNLN